MKSEGHRFILGVESLTGLVAGASALVAFVAALVLWLTVGESVSALEASALSRAAFTAAALGSRPSQTRLQELAEAFIPGGGISAVAVMMNDTLAMAYPTLDPAERSQWETVSHTARSGEYNILMVVDLPPSLKAGRAAAAVMALFAIFLTAVAVLTPRYLRKTVLEPLRNILGQADRIDEGGGRSAAAADDSFRKLVDQLSMQDRQLKEMRARALERAETAESRSGAVLEAMDSSVVVLDSRMKPTLWNSSALSVLGPSPESWTGEAALAPFVKHGNREWDSELGGRNYRFSAAGGESGETVVLITDVTESLQLERKLSEESALADLGAFSGGVAHEIGNALCALEGFMTLLARGGDSERTGELLREASLEVDSARRVVEAFRRIAVESTIGSSISCSEALAVIENLAESKGVVFRGRNSLASDCMVPGSAVILTRILDNLLTNAIRIAGRETVVVEAGFTGSSGNFVFSVQDGGPGLPDDPEIVFKPMYSSGEGDGMGLGLTIARRLVRAMGGKMTAAHRPEGGAIFTVRIPAEERKQ
ncbi:hypothetical protein CSA37_05030 [Candidatus Fermentibacteria bacterium]|nr:MAG: hypothetical protein CSA37_10320 [Candidatus Fermentibacteria bacterium]PIE52292.1 MAG: hypothetical protein CSA37_07425 [Candidatus Fermentibacteria bacterium]PIE52787.1 MAG: hypothetical protein CSA37_05030 [Candidatus Fermentibacteria bacterium]